MEAETLPTQDLELYARVAEARAALMRKHGEADAASNFDAQARAYRAELAERG